MDATVALTRMGYRELRNGSNKWAKPIGYMLFVFKVTSDGQCEFESWFMAANGKPMVYNRHVFPIGDDIITKIKDAECYARIDVNTCVDAKFDFLTVEQMMEKMMVG